MEDDAPIPLMSAAKRQEAAAAAEPAPAAPAAAVPARKRGWGGLLGIIAIVVLIITAAFYSWGEQLAARAPEAAGAGADLPR